DDLEFALGLGVDFVALSFVRSAADVRELKGPVEQAGSEAHVIAKIEKSEAVEALVPILDESDAVMVARGDLGVEMGPEVVPFLQKGSILPAPAESGGDLRLRCSSRWCISPSRPGRRPATSPTRFSTAPPR